MKNSEIVEIKNGQIVWVPMKVYKTDLWEDCPEEGENTLWLHVAPHTDGDCDGWDYVERDAAFAIKSQFVKPMNPND